MKIKNEDIREALTVRLLQDFMTAPEAKRKGYYDIALQYATQNKGLKIQENSYNTVGDNNLLHSYENYITSLLSDTDDAYNRKRRLIRMVEKTKEYAKEVTQTKLHTLDDGEKQQLLFILEYIFYSIYSTYDIANVGDIEKDTHYQYQKLAVTLTISINCQQDTLESIVLDFILNQSSLSDMITKQTKGVLL